MKKWRKFTKFDFDFEEILYVSLLISSLGKQINHQTKMHLPETLVLVLMLTVSFLFISRMAFGLSLFDNLPISDGEGTGQRSQSARCLENQP